MSRRIEGKDLVYHTDHLHSKAILVPRELAFKKRFCDEEWDYAPTMAQWNRTADDPPRSIEQLIARRLLRQNVADIVIGPPQRRLAYIEEIRAWMAPGADAIAWSWDYWCEQLDWDPDFMRRKWTPFLDKCEVKAKELMTTALRDINGHRLEQANRRGRAHWKCQYCGIDSLIAATEKDCDKKGL